MYHTQEDRGSKLIGPIECLRPDAWLGSGYYFWLYENDAIEWGIFSKKSAFKRYAVYKAHIDCSNVLDTVFDEDGYNTYREIIEQLQKFFARKGILNPTFEEFNRYLEEKVRIREVYHGIMIQDLPRSSSTGQVNRILMTRRRIQLAVYNLEIVSNFALHLSGEN